MDLLNKEVQIELDVDNLVMYRLYAKKSLSWLTQHIENFSPIRKNDSQLDGIKVFSELTLVYAYIKNWKHLEFDSEISTWHSFLEDHLENKLYAEAIRKKPVASYAFMFPYLLMRSTGYRSKYYEESYQYMKRWGYFESIELVPFRQFDVEFFLWKSGLQIEPDWKKRFTSTVLGCCRSPLALGKMAAYSITHTLFYMTDFGNRPLPLSQTEVKDITNIVESLLLHYWRVGNYDLMGELLINLKCLDKDNTYLYRNASEAFLGVWNEDGSVPALKEQRGTDKQNNFNMCYHTTLVGVLLCSIEMNKILQKETLK